MARYFLFSLLAALLFASTLSADEPALGFKSMPTDHKVSVEALKSMPKCQPGQRVTWVAKGGPADQAGIAKGDIVTAVGGRSVPNQSAWVKVSHDFKVGKPIKIKFQRSEKRGKKTAWVAKEVELTPIGQEEFFAILDKLPPVEITINYFRPTDRDKTVGRETFLIPELSATITCQSRKAITYYSHEIDCKDNTGIPVVGANGQSVIGGSTGDGFLMELGESKDIGGVMDGKPATAEVILRINTIKFEDGTITMPKKGEEFKATAKLETPPSQPAK